VNSLDQHPTYIYEEPGTYTVSLAVSGESLSHTVVCDDCIRVFDGESALQFDGDASCVVCPAAPTVNLTGALTIEAWINPCGWGEVPTLGFGRVMDKECIALYLIGSHPGFNDHSLALELRHAGGSISFSTTPEMSVSLNSWQHVAVTYEGTTGVVMMYINGTAHILSQTSSPSGPLEDNGLDNLIIGSEASGNSAFEGAIDEVRVWVVSRSGDDIQQNMNAYLHGSEPGLVGYWKMNEGNGEALFDHSPNGNDGTVVDAAWIQGVHLSPASVDDDGDGILNWDDNCPGDSNPGQEDVDTDGVGDVCDNCPMDANSDQADGDGDGSGDVCDACMDTDGDGYGDPGYPDNLCEEDNCPGVYNPDQAPVERGDVNCEDGINVLDVLAVVNHILGTSPLRGGPLERADCNGTGGVNIVDALGIINVILGIGECVPGVFRPMVTPEVMAYCRSLEPFLSAEAFAQFMGLVRAQAKVPGEYSLAQNYPNPFNPTTSIHYSVMCDGSPAHVTLKIFNLLGQGVRTLVDDVREPGIYTVTWDGRDSAGREASSGVYFCRLVVDRTFRGDSEDFTATRCMVLMK